MMDTIEISNVINQNIRTDWVSWPCLAIILPQRKRATYCRKIFCLVSHVSKMIWSPTCVSRMAFNWLGLIYECVIFYIVILKTVIKCFTLRIPGNLFCSTHCPWKPRMRDLKFSWSFHLQVLLIWVLCLVRIQFY